jgi:hypothetical protein
MAAATSSAATTSVRVGWLAWQLLPIGYLLLAAIQWTSKDPADHRVALPLALAAVVTVAVNLFLRPGGTARADTQQPDRAHLPRRPSCESCWRSPGTVAVRFPDGVAFAVCAGCLAAGVVLGVLDQSEVADNPCPIQFEEIVRFDVTVVNALFRQPGKRFSNLENRSDDGCGLRISSQTRPQGPREGHHIPQSRR